MGREDVQLSTAKRAYKEAASVGNVQEEARWANVIGDILKNRGEYIEALKWLRIDYDVSVNHLPEKQVLPTCQSLGEVYLRLQNFEEALIYQEEHLKLAKESNDLVEQQRATTQLGRTYHEMFLKSEDDHDAVRNAKKYFKSSMNLARTLKENTSSHRSSHFLKEFIDAHNNLGMLEMDLDNLEEAERILLEGLRICNEEEVIEDDDGRSRLNHNLGSVYMEMRMWDKAREHIEKDIRICKRIEHRQGEAKGYINLGELHYRVQKYDEALLCYQKAIRIAKTMEDEDALVENINQNIKIIKEAVKVMNELKKEEQNLKKLTRTTTMAKGTPRERKFLLQQNAALDVLIEKSSIIFAWLKHLDFAKRKKKVANELCDKEKLSDSFLAIGESYQKLRKFKKAFKWYSKSLNLYKSIGNLEGQALAKINIGDVLDGDGDWIGALEAFKEGYRQGLAVEASMPSIQISALDNMHYSYMIRFDETDEARRLQLKIQELKSSKATVSQIQKLQGDCCSETETEGNDGSSDTTSNTCESIKISESSSTRSKTRKEFEDDETLIELCRSNKNISKTKISQLAKPRNSINQAATSAQNLQKSNSSQYPSVSRKRGRVVLLDDDESDEAEISRSTIQKVPIEDVVASYEFKMNGGSTSFANDFQDETHFVASKDMLNVCSSRNYEESSCSQKSRSLNRGAKDTNCAASASKVDADYISDNQHHISVQIDDQNILVDTRSCMLGDMLSIECMKVEVACLYYLQLSEEKKSRGLLPIIRHMKCGDKALKPLELVEALKDNLWDKRFVEVAIDGWVQKRLMKLYIDCCKKLREAPNMKLLNKLYNLEVSEDEVVVSGCQLQDISIAPLLDGLRQHKTIAMLDLSHNLLGNETMEKLKQIFMLSSQKYGGLTLDLHCNRLGPTALFQICECPVLFARLEVLNISGNRLTDACGSYLSTILENCKALYSLSIDNCSITSRTIQKVADSIDSGSVLAQLSLGHNNPISGNSMVNLLAKLTTLTRFSELNLNGIKLSKPAVDRVCGLAKTSCLSGLMLGGTNISNDGALELMKALSTGPQELVRLDLSYCGLSSHSFQQLCADLASIGGILELNLGGNPIGQEGVNALTSLLVNPQCCLRVLVLNKCCLGLAGVTKIIQALAGNDPLQELNLAGNVNMDMEDILQSGTAQGLSSKCIQPDLNLCNTSPSKKFPDDVGDVQQDISLVNSECNHLEVADSEDGLIKAEPTLSALDDSATSSCRRTTTQPQIQLIQELSAAIGLARQLQLLDLSSNGFTQDLAEALYTAWSSTLRSGGSAQRHVKEHTVHFSVDGKKCCGVEICCKKD
ncbi:hypothetical protein AQUCO_02200346v1 [Aquilegia coerulea]|uniref:Protein TONSOKU n=1 Tax=Aquilegia coerulea TaxID=218851 RepID=A0A2G5DE91_AQUCA|nr:hypothetical protein AQUCO_02200346v1 [Aquilegia coerulea]